MLGCRIDYLATHDYRGEADKVMERLEMLHHRSGLHCSPEWRVFTALRAGAHFYVDCLLFRYGKKVWLTEFAKCCTRDQDEVIDFVKVRGS